MDIPSLAIQIGSGGTFAVIATFFLKRYISMNDRDIKNLRSDLNHHAERIFVHSKELSDHKVEVVKAIASAKDNFRTVEERILEKTSNVLTELRETKVSLNQALQDLKEKKNDDKEMYGKIIWVMNKIPLIENQYQDILNALHRNGRR
jgi:vacuolar-type H+-ATPase subunit I/STV1